MTLPRPNSILLGTKGPATPVYSRAATASPLNDSMFAQSLGVFAVSLVLSFAPFSPKTLYQTVDHSIKGDDYDEMLPLRDMRFRDSMFTVVEDSLVRWEAEVRAFTPLNAVERAALHKAAYHEHITASRRVGISAGRYSRRLTPVSTGNPYYVTGWDGLLADQAIATLELIGARFQEECRRAHLPAARFIVTSTFRSADRQAELRETNGNATKGQSSHEFGGSFDIGYNRFLPVHEGTGNGFYQLDGGIPPRLLATLQEAVSVREEGFAAGVIERHPEAYAAAMGRALIALEADGKVLALQEFLQPCFHVTAKGARAKA